MEGLFPSGILLIDKPEKISSFDVIRRIRSQLGRELSKKISLGHMGTLDPFATGLMLVGVQEGLKLSQYFLGCKKTYQGTLQFGIETDTGDLTGQSIQTTGSRPCSFDEIQLVANQFLGTPYLQVPPMYSAVKHHGKRLYEIARQGQEVERTSKEKTIFLFNIERPTPAKADLIQEVSFTVTCSSGTYIRVLAQDLAKRMGTLAHLVKLRRTHSIFDVSNAMELDRLTENLDLNSPSSWQGLKSLIPLHLSIPHIRRMDITAPIVKWIRTGNHVQLNEELPSPIDNEITAVYENKNLVALLKGHENKWHIQRVFNTIV